VNGIIYVLTGGEDTTRDVSVSAKSAKRAMPEVPITVFCDRDITGPVDEVRRIRPVGSTEEFFGLRIEILGESPYDRTLHLDTDTYIARDASVLFTLLDRFDLAIAHDTHRIPVPLDGIPDAFPEFNAGVIAYRTDALRLLLPRWLELHERFAPATRKDRSGHADGVSYDQPWLRQALYESDLRIATLPPEFNFRFGHAGFYNLPVAILHAQASEAEFEEVARVATHPHSAYWSSYVHCDRQLWGPHGSARKLLDLRPRWQRHRLTRGLRRLVPQAAMTRYVSKGRLR
jgi:hypothetical protein